MTSSKISLAVSVFFVIAFVINFVAGDKTLYMHDWILGVAFGMSVVQIGDFLVGRGSK